MKRLSLVFLFLLASSMSGNVSAQTALQAGDIALIGMNTDTPDAFAFVLLVPADAGTQITFTDCGWKSDSLIFRAGEGAVTYTAPSALTAGTVIIYDSTNAAFSDFAKYTGTIITSSLLLATDGDQLLAFQGGDSLPSFLYAVNDTGTEWQANAWSSRTSALPAGLVNGQTAVALSHYDNYAYNGITTGTKEELLSAIGDSANWTLRHNTTRQTMPTGPFNVTGVEGSPGDQNLPGSFSLNAWPNPANHGSRISFKLPGPVTVEFSIFNIAGQKITSLASGYRKAGVHRLSWNLKDSKGNAVPTGIYFYQLLAGNQSVVQKLLVVR
ncbi:MAG: FlgD immunoglobulin-like domain containing protein [bacterium]|nr:FlgD immunoglobulin-like domain containing protein [bacterium]